MPVASRACLQGKQIRTVVHTGKRKANAQLSFSLRARAKGASLSLLTCIWGSLGTLAK
ncbi:hypothetical protein GCM10027571_15540 [Polaromonas eurypsychrophila]